LTANSRSHASPLLPAGLGAPLALALILLLPATAGAPSTALVFRAPYVALASTANSTDVGGPCGSATGAWTAQPTFSSTTWNGSMGMRGSLVSVCGPGNGSAGAGATLEGLLNLSDLSFSVPTNGSYWVHVAWRVSLSGYGVANASGPTSTVRTEVGVLPEACVVDPTATHSPCQPVDRVHNRTGYFDDVRAGSFSLNSTDLLVNSFAKVYLVGGHRYQLDAALEGLVETGSASAGDTGFGWLHVGHAKLTKVTIS